MPIQKNVSFTHYFRMVDANGAGVAGTPTCKRSLDGAAFAACTNAPSSVSSGAGGEWSIVLTTTEMNTANTAFEATLTGAIPVYDRIYPEADYTTARATELDTIAGYLDTEIAAIKAKTDNLPASPAATGDVAAGLTAQGYTTTRATKLDTIDSIYGVVDTEVAAIKAKTDNLPASPANETTLATIAGYIDTEVGAIKAKTDNLPASPAAVGSAMTLTSGERTSIGTAVWATTLAALTDVNTIGGFFKQQMARFITTTISIVTPVAVTGDVTVYLGYDYKTDQGRQLQWSATTWPNLATATIAMVNLDGTTIKVGVATVTGTDTLQTVTVDLTEAEIAALGRGVRRFQIRATISGEKTILLQGRLAIR